MFAKAFGDVSAFSVLAHCPSVRSALSSNRLSCLRATQAFVPMVGKDEKKKSEQARGRQTEPELAEPAAKKQRGSPAKVADAALEAAAAPLETAVEKLAFNAGYYATIDNHIKQIDEDLVLGDVRSAPPLAISRELEAGFQEPWF